MDKGVKPKKLNVATNIRCEDARQLRDLIRVIEARGAHGEGKVYNITNREANAAGIKQVRVSDRFSWKPIDGVKAWAVAFTLREYLSVPEKAEKREKTPEPVAQKSEGTAIAPKQPDAEPQTAVAVQEPQTMLESILHKIDEALA
ncbi:hypothetical protein [Halodesulfovibrio sp.]|uniref:baseplate complex protein n=1 Tax=Halodesulfovibrio sp. TaxID=1912772 RepID=UPI0025D0A5AF|nr:hypothetical protein [Halodesulfovibrio sp.]MCT4627963.1 hypothetical protein [Halodesulfovibrio sp.]